MEIELNDARKRILELEEQVKKLTSNTLLCAGLNDKHTTEAERTLFNIFDKYQINPMLQPNLAIEILKALDAELERR